eukprot:gene965-1873_t
MNYWFVLFSLGCNIIPCTLGFWGYSLPSVKSAYKNVLFPKFEDKSQRSTGFLIFARPKKSNEIPGLLMLCLFTHLIMTLFLLDTNKESSPEPAAKDPSQKNGKNKPNVLPSDEIVAAEDVSTKESLTEYAEASGVSKKGRGRPKSKPSIEKKGTNAKDTSSDVPARRSSKSDPFGDSSLDLTNFLGDGFELPEDLESLLPNLDDDLAKLEANLGSLHGFDLDMDMDESLFMSNSSMGTSLTDLEFEEALRGIESGKFDMSEFMLGDADTEDTDSDAEEAKIKLKLSQGLAADDEEEELVEEDMGSIGSLEDMLRGHDLGSEEEDVLLDVVGSRDEDEEEEEEEAPRVTRFQKPVAGSKKGKSLAGQAKSSSVSGSGSSVMGGGRRKDKGDVDVDVDLDLDLDLDLEALDLSELPVDPNEALVVGGIELDKEEFSLGVDPPPLEEFRRLMEALGGDSTSMFASGEGDVEDMDLSATPPVKGKGGGSSSSSSDRSKVSSSSSDNDDDSDSDSDEEGDVMDMFDVNEILPPEELIFRPQIYAGGDPNTHIYDLPFKRPELEEGEVEEEIPEDTLEAEKSLQAVDWWANHHDRPTEWRLQIVSVVTNSSANSSALDIVEQVYDYIRIGTGNDSRINFQTIVCAFEEDQPFEELDDLIQMWCEGYNTYHLVDGAAMKEVWGTIMPHVMLSVKNLDAILHQVKWALDEDGLEGALLTPRLRRMRVRGGAQDMIMGYNTEHLDSEFSVVSVR